MQNTGVKFKFDDWIRLDGAPVNVINPIHIYFISNLVAKAPNCNSGENLSNLLSNHEALN